MATPFLNLFYLSVVLSLTSHSVFAEVKMVVEQGIGDPNVAYIDPEFEAGTFQSSFINFKDGGLYLGKIDPETGRFVDHVYKYIDTAAPVYKTFNGPEWGYSVNGPSIYYTKPDATGSLHNFRYRDGKVTQLDSGDFNLVANYCSKNEGDANTMVMGALNPLSSVLQSLTLNFGVFLENTPNVIKSYTLASIGKGPRFVPGARQITTNLIDKSGNVQVAVYDYDSNRTNQISFDSGSKNSAVAFRAPELSNEMLISSMVLAVGADSQTKQKALSLLPHALKTGFDKLANTVGQLGQSLRIYRKSGSSWLPYKEINPSNGTLLMNAQVFSYKGKTFFSMEQFTASTVITNHSIVIQDMAGKVKLVVSGSSNKVRFDPEVVISGDKMFIYYYDIPTMHLYLSEVTIPKEML